MRLSQLFTKTLREAPTDETSKNAQLLIRAGYIHKTMPGVYSFLPLGLRVLGNVENIVRKNLNEIGGKEIFMNGLQPKEWWLQTGRWETVDVLFKLQSQTETEYALAPTHEEQITPILKNYINSWKDLPEYKEFLFDYSEEITEHFDAVEDRHAAHAIIYNPKLDRFLVTDDPFKIGSRYLNYPAGGKIEDGETSQQAIVREVEEETGIKSNELKKVVYLGKIRQSFWVPQWQDKPSKNKIMVSEMFYIETDSELEGFVDANKANSQEYSVWRTKEEISGDILPGFEWILENYNQILLGEIKTSFPLSVYQIQTKFRDELRSKAGLMRGREFRMKDLYDLHRTQESQDAYYETIKKTYLKIYRDMGLDAHVVQASGGVFAKYSHEFQAICPAGEDWTVVWSNGVNDNLEIAQGYPTDTNKVSEGEMMHRDSLGEAVKSVEDHAKSAGVSVDRILKSVLFVTLEAVPRYIGVAIRGDLEVNEELLMKALDCGVRKAETADMELVGTVRGRFTPIVQIAEKYQKQIEWIFDRSLEGAKGMVSSYYTSVEVDRDLVTPARWECLSIVQTGFVSGSDSTVVVNDIVRSSEIGNIFKLGTKWTKAFEVTYTDQNNERMYPVMGCHGIGTSRCVGVLAEINSDEKGLKWPESVAPFKYHLVSMIQDKDTVENKLKIVDVARRIYSGQLRLDVESKTMSAVSDSNSYDEVLWDDRAGLGMGEKLTDAELIGCPFIVIVSKRSLENGGVEVKNRSTGESEIIHFSL